MASCLGLEKVGFMFSHPPGREGYHFSTHEILNAGLACLEATQGQKDSPFVVLKGTLDDDNKASFDAFQLTEQCLEMVAEEALLEMAQKPGLSAVDEMYTAIVEAKQAHVVDNDFFIQRVPILAHDSGLASAAFPRYNRLHEFPSNEELAKLIPLGEPTKELVLERVADFNVLLFLSQMFGLDELADICESVRGKVFKGEFEEKPLKEGYVFMISSMAHP